MVLHEKNAQHKSQYATASAVLPLSQTPSENGSTFDSIICTMLVEVSETNIPFPSICFTFMFKTFTAIQAAMKFKNSIFADSDLA